MERSPSFRKKIVPVDHSIRMLSKLLKKCHERSIIEELKQKENDLLKSLEEEKKELSDLTNYATLVADLRRRYEIEKEIENTIDGKIGAAVLKIIENCISLIKQERGKIEIQSGVFESEGRVYELASETLAKLETFQKQEKAVLDEIIELNKIFPKLDEYLNESYDDQKGCSELLGLAHRLTIHAQALKTINPASFDSYPC